MNYHLIIGIESIVCILIVIFFLKYRNNVHKKLYKKQLIDNQIQENGLKLKAQKADLVSLKKMEEKLKKEIALYEQNIESNNAKKNNFLTKLKNLTKLMNDKKIEFNKINNDTLDLQKLKANADQIETKIRSYSENLASVKNEIHDLEQKKKGCISKIEELMSRVDIYSRLDDFVSFGHFEEPTYLYETSARFSEEIKRFRLKQKQHIKDKTAITYPISISITSDQKKDQNILNGQINLMLTSFNIECDYLISRVKPSTFTRILEQIEKLSTKLEKSAVSLHCGFNTEYVKLKYEECKLQYQYMLKKQEELEEKRLIKERMQEEVKAQKEYERAIAEAQKEERIYRKMLERAKQSLGKGTEDDRIITQQRIEDLEQQLAEAVAKSERVKSLAEQTRRGHVYVISNVGAFGKSVCKIGLTRRLDPLDRVKELGGASVPFKFDVHAIIYSEDAPALEASLHRKFKNRRVNVVNSRKEYFHADLPEVKTAVEELVGHDVDFKFSVLAEEYFESRRLRSEATIQHNVG